MALIRLDAGEVPEAGGCNGGAPAGPLAKMAWYYHPHLADDWLSPDAAAEEAKALLRPYAGAMTAYPVSKAVGSVKNDNPSLIEPLEA